MLAEVKSGAHIALEHGKTSSLSRWFIIYTTLQVGAYLAHTALELGLRGKLSMPSPIHGGLVEFTSTLSPNNFKVIKEYHNHETELAIFALRYHHAYLSNPSKCCADLLVHGR